MLEDRRGKPHPHQMVKCPRCESPDTKFCYYNNYSTTQPRYFCKNCKRYWTNGGALRNVPVGGGLRKNKRSKQKTNNTSSSSSSSSTLLHKPSTSSSCNADDHHNHSLPNPSPLHPNPAYPPSPCIYDTGDQSAHALPYHHFNYNHPGFNYPPPPLPPPPPPPVSMEGFPHGEGGFGSVYNPLSSSRSQSNSGETSEVSMEPRSEAMKSALFTPPQVVGLSSYGLASDDHTATAREDGRHKDNSNGGANDSINNYNYMQRLGYGDEQQQVNKWREEGLTNVVNVYDWQQISEGLFGGGGGDFFYMPTHPATWSDFDSGTRL